MKDLSQNKIEILNMEHFFNLSLLKSLDLSQNKIKVLKCDVFFYLKNLIIIWYKLKYLIDNCIPEQGFL